jgi:hypothetical protein
MGPPRPVTEIVFPSILPIFWNLTPVQSVENQPTFREENVADVLRIEE